MTFRKQEDTGNWKKHYIALCGELALENTMELSYYRLRDDDDDDDDTHTDNRFYAYAIRHMWWNIKAVKLRSVF